VTEVNKDQFGPVCKRLSTSKGTLLTKCVLRAFLVRDNLSTAVFAQAFSDGPGSQDEPAQVDNVVADVMRWRAYMPRNNSKLGADSRRAKKSADYFRSCASGEDHGRVVLRRIRLEGTHVLAWEVPSVTSKGPGYQAGFFGVIAQSACGSVDRQQHTDKPCCNAIVIKRDDGVSSGPIGEGQPGRMELAND